MVAPPGGGAFRKVATGITMGAAPIKEPSVTFLNGPTVTILKMHIPRADYSMGIRTIAGYVRDGVDFSRARALGGAPSEVSRSKASNPGQGESRDEQLLASGGSE